MSSSRTITFTATRAASGIPRPPQASKIPLPLQQVLSTKCDALLVPDAALDQDTTSPDCKLAQLLADSPVAAQSATVPARVWDTKPTLDLHRIGYEADEEHDDNSAWLAELLADTPTPAQSPPTSVTSFQLGAPTPGAAALAELLADDDDDDCDDAADASPCVEKSTPVQPASPVFEAPATLMIESDDSSAGELSESDDETAPPPKPLACLSPSVVEASINAAMIAPESTCPHIRRRARQRRVQPWELRADGRNDPLTTETLRLADKEKRYRYLQPLQSPLEMRDEVVQDFVSIMAILCSNVAAHQRSMKLAATASTLAKPAQTAMESGSCCLSQRDDPEQALPSNDSEHHLNDADGPTTYRCSVDPLFESSPAAPAALVPVDKVAQCDTDGRAIASAGFGMRTGCFAQCRPAKRASSPLALKNAHRMRRHQKSLPKLTLSLLPVN